MRRLRRYQSSAVSHPLDENLVSAARTQKAGRAALRRRDDVIASVIAAMESASEMNRAGATGR
jgi:hypothetical protein